MMLPQRHRAKRSDVPMKRIVELVGGALLLGGCTLITPPGQNVTPYQGPAPYLSVTPTDAALRCLKPYTAKLENLRVGVADFVDGTGAGAGENDINTRMLTQRPDLMLMVALRKAGVRLVNRTSIGVVEWEMKEAMAKRLGEGKPVTLDNNQFAYRPIQAGALLGSTYYLNGAITEYNYNISSNTAELGGLGLMGGRRTYRTSVAVDLAVTKSTSTEVVLARSYAKQLEGQEIGGGVFRFFDVAMGLTRIELFEANVGEKRNEPVQTALRWVIETAAYDLLSELTGRHPECEKLLPGFRDNNDLPYARGWDDGDRKFGEPSTPVPAQAPKDGTPRPEGGAVIVAPEARMEAPSTEGRQASASQPLVPQPSAPPPSIAPQAAADAPSSGVSVEMQQVGGCSRLAINLPAGIVLSFSKSGVATQVRFQPALPILLQGTVPALFETVQAAPGTLDLRTKGDAQITATAHAAQLMLTAGPASSPARCAR